MQHTPGPWHFYKDRPTDANQQKPNPWYEVRGESRDVATIWNNPVNPHEAASNAKLITAAPKAYELADMIRDLSKFSDETWTLNKQKVVDAAYAFLNDVEDTGE